MVPQCSQCCSDAKVHNNTPNYQRLPKNRQFKCGHALCPVEPPKHITMHQRQGDQGEIRSRILE